MEQALPVVIVAAFIAMAAALVVILREQEERPATTPDSPLAISTEGEKLCPTCGMGNLWTDVKCLSCGAALR